MLFFFFSSRRRHTICALVTGVQTCALPIYRDTITRKAPWVDVVFGTHNIGSLPVLLERARVQEEAQVEILESLEVFPSTLPTKRDSAYAAWVSISVGRSEEHTSELQSLMRISYAVLCLKKKKKTPAEHKQ